MSADAQMAEAHRLDMAQQRENSALMGHLDVYMTTREDRERTVPKFWDYLILVREKLADENEQIVRRWN